MASEGFQQALQMIKAMRDQGGLGSEDGSLDIASMRAGMDGQMFPTPEGVTVTPVTANGVPAEWIVAEGASTANRLLYLHGGGYIMGGLNSHRTLAAGLSQSSGCAVLSADYRLAPEHPHPAAVEDGVAAYKFVRSNGPGGPSPANRVFIGGDSAGGGLTLATLLALKEQGAQQADAAITLSAWTDLAATGQSMISRAEIDPMIAGAAAVGPMARLYAGDQDIETPTISPLYADLSGLPPLYMQVGDAEVLLDDTIRVAEKARAAGVEVICEPWDEMFHVWQLFAPIIPEGQQAIEKLGGYLKARCG